MRTWQIQEAKSRLSTVLRDAEREGPQAITVFGRSVAVVLSRAEDDWLAGTGESLAGFVRRSPLASAEDLDFSRTGSPAREVEL